MLKRSKCILDTSMEMSTIDGFNKSLEELLRFADSLKLREKELEQQHCLDFERQKTEYELQIQIEKRRNEQLQEINRTLTEQVERATQKQVELEQKNTVGYSSNDWIIAILFYSIDLGFSYKI